ncbi:AraC family transcriptional regulator [Gluconacetobacter azotocaptans]|uniref:AraC family transcriptional regulator n=1 Tax=Gluconacetobacter azotocaptans TaxID=142834 RepID=UPI00195839AC|nr:AraC family transcriptional regulator [Gluconacetobacter azotocaptans]MBM9400015.1 AraC family transcriptional regulator [Gluconacetobacter azotocaptans]
MNHLDPGSRSLAPSSKLPGSGADGDHADLLSHVLALIHLKGERIYAANLRAPWSLSFKAGPAHFIFVTEGTLQARIAGLPSLRATEGDLLLLPRGSGHIIRDNLGASGMTTEMIDINELQQGHLLMRGTEGGEQTTLVGGSFGFDGNEAPSILAFLPPILSISRNNGDNAEWLETLAHFLLAEAHRPAPGVKLMISRLIDLLVIRTLRSWADNVPSHKGWLGGLGDPKIARALSAMHMDISRRWTVSDLAGIAGMSRSAFAERFAARVGDTPLRYLMKARLFLASDLLDADALTAREVAHRIGYSSDAAFSRAFKVQFGRSPTELRSS